MMMAYTHTHTMKFTHTHTWILFISRHDYILIDWEKGDRVVRVRERTPETMSLVRRDEKKRERV